MNRVSTIPWKRFWCPLGEPIDCGEAGRGFLQDPEAGGFGRRWSPHTLTLDELLARPCLVLCGEPGLGKTKAIELAKETIASAPGSDRDPLWLAFREIPTLGDFRRRTFESQKWREWREAKTSLTLVVDGVDEGLLRVPQFIPYLAAELRSNPVDRLRLILVCRTAEWSIAAGEELTSLWGESGAKSVCSMMETHTRWSLVC